MKKIILIPSYEPDEKLLELLHKINNKEFDIIIVNDGSGKKYNQIFNKTKSKAKLIEYTENQGKGHAIKKGLKFIKETYTKDYIIITMDSDGQHKIEDAKKLANYIEKNPDNLVLGKRLRTTKTPLRSKIGNSITKFIYKITTNIEVYDTQTGLRAFSNKLIDFYLTIPGERFEYEMNVLLYTAYKKIPIHEIEIETIYIDNNSKSHFKTFKDSLKIYKEIIKFSIVKHK